MGRLIGGGGGGIFVQLVVEAMILSLFDFILLEICILFYICNNISLIRTPI